VFTIALEPNSYPDSHRSGLLALYS